MFLINYLIKRILRLLCLAFVFVFFVINNVEIYQQFKNIPQITTLLLIALKLVFIDFFELY